MTIKAGEAVAMSVGLLIGLGSLIGGSYLIINKSGDKNAVVDDTRFPVGDLRSSYNENNPGFDEEPGVDGDPGVGGGALFLKKGGSRNKRRKPRKTRKTKKPRKGRVRRRTNKR